MVPSRKIVLFLLSVLLFSACGKPEAPEYYGFRDARMSKGAGGLTVLATTLKLFNPNHFNITLRGGEMDVYVNDRLSGHSVLDTSIYIPRKDTFYVPVSMQVNMQDILSHALASLFGKEVKITVNGRVKLRRDGFPFSVPFHYEANQDLNGLLSSGN
ncbi:MAG: LEA type 2 family protein [Bacteroidota bacterium]|nr:LEA type 2 family protein [Bacteroidota bacterium]MDP4215322.1 LEA type 2 family protein [Bacteroidota bacterium]MDP4245009.1 LEA type 2 family protein [Bacteroidota bacterium]MDP4252885.1 LEA type 2 family protein [Bacteroidota bacterium]MDP4259126.1 LEA type 2 family protein [Bacteroidota bacterium]